MSLLLELHINVTSGQGHFYLNQSAQDLPVCGQGYAVLKSSLKIQMDYCTLLQAQHELSPSGKQKFSFRVLCYLLVFWGFLGFFFC